MNTLTAENIKKKVFLFSLPLALSMLTQQLYSIVDTVIVGRYMGVDGLAAVGNAGTIIMLIIMISGGLELGSEVVFSRYVGVKDFTMIRNGAISILGFGFVLSILCTVIGIISMDTVLVYTSTPANLMVLCKEYLFYYFLGIIFVFGYDISRAILITLGKSKLAFILILCTSVSNIFLDIIFVGYFSWGIEGVAIATILSQAMGMSLTLIILFLEINTYSLSTTYTLQREQVIDILKVAFPSMLQQAITAISALLLQKAINPFGNEIISGYIAINKITTFSIIVLNSFSQTLSIFSAQCLAANRKDIILIIYKFFIKISIFYISVICIVFIVFSKQLSNFFFDTTLYPLALSFVKSYLNYSIVFLYISIFKFFHESILRGSEHMTAFLISNICDLVTKVTLTYLLVNSVSLHAFWLGNTFARIFSFIISLYYLYKYQLLDFSTCLPIYVTKWLSIQKK